MSINKSNPFLTFVQLRTESLLDPEAMRSLSSDLNESLGEISEKRVELIRFLGVLVEFNSVMS